MKEKLCDLIRLIMRCTKRIIKIFIPSKIRLMLRNKIRDINPPVMFVTPADLIIPPYKGRPTVQQFIVVSRVLDIENIKPGYFQYWEKKLTELHNKKPPVFDKHNSLTFYELVQILNQYGLKPELSTVEAGIAPATINNGTHRLAYFIVTHKMNKFIPVRPGYTLWFPVDGIEYYIKLGMTNEDINTIISKHNQIISSLDCEYIALIDNEHTKSSNFCDIAKQIGCSKISQPIKIINTNYKDGYQYRKFTRRLENFTSLRVLSIPITAQFLQYKKGYLVSRESENINNILTKSYGKKWGIISSCLTESIELKIFLRVFCKFDTQESGAFVEVK